MLDNGGGVLAKASLIKRPIGYEAGDRFTSSISVGGRRCWSWSRRHIGLKKLSGLELLVKGFALLSREGLWLFRNPFVGCSLFRGELLDEVFTAACE